VFKAAAEWGGGSWQSIGRTYLLVRQPDDLLQETASFEGKSAALSKKMDEFAGTLTRSQLEALRSGRALAFISLDPRQKSLFRDIVKQHYAIAPGYPRSLVDNPAGWVIESNRRGLDLNVDGAHRVVSFDWKKFVY
jgi:hypothetical protein